MKAAGQLAVQRPHCMHFSKPHDLSRRISLTAFTGLLRATLIVPATIQKYYQLSPLIILSLKEINITFLGKKIMFDIHMYTHRA
jgi:hypothetical protein